MTTDLKTPKGHMLSLKRPSGRFIISVASGLLASSLTAWRAPSIPWWVHVVAGWDVAAFTLLVFAWSIILPANAKETKGRAAEDDPGHYVVFVIAVVTSLVGLFAVVVALHAVKDFPSVDKAVWRFFTIAAVPLSWAVTHTAYTFRYAHKHYQTMAAQERHAKGDLKFSGTDDPADFDFAYFAITIGMCFQVSDVVVLTTAMRREVLVHAVLSFLYNTAILALALNVVSGLIS
jgi:uncharacterized membrane protein